jgi:AraC-like DNA-binding protein/uncharacterized protein YqfB (UPF0267 family)
MGKSSFLTKMTIFSCILCILPVMFIGFSSYLNASREIQKQVNLSQRQILSQMNSNVEQTLQTVKHALNQLVDSTAMSRVFNNVLTEQDFVIYQDLRKEMINTQNYYTNLEDVVIVNMQQNWMMKNSGFYEFDDYLHYSQISNQIMLSGNSSWVLNPTVWFYSEMRANLDSCPYTISLVQKLPSYSSYKTGMAFANISSCSMPSILNYTPRESETVMILDDQDRVVYHNEPGMIGQYALNTRFIPNTLILKGTDGQFQTEVDGKEYTATYLRSEMNNWVYVSIISIDSLTKEAVKTRNFTIVMMAVIVAVFMTVAWFFSRRMYTPIQRLVRQMTGKSTLTSRVNEFDIISSSFQDLSLSKTQLEQESFRYLQQARDFFLMRLLQGSMRRQDVMEKMDQFGFTPKLEDMEQLSVIVVQIDTLNETHYMKEDMDLLLFAVQNIIEELVPQSYRLAPVSFDQTVSLVVGREKMEPEEYNSWIYSLTESIQQMVQSILKLTVSIGISLPSSDIKHVPIAFREGLEALKHRIHLGIGVIIHYAHVNKGRPQQNLDYPWLTESELFDAVRLADEVKARELLEKLMGTIFKHEMSPQEYQVPINKLLNNIQIMMQESGIRLSQLNAGGESLYEELQKVPLAKEIEDWFWQRIIEPLIILFRERQASQYQSMSETILDRIHKQFDTPLTIEGLAAELHYNANYLSSVFRKETGQSFSEYLSAFRFSMAKKWLIETDMTVKEISERLQFQNSQNFIRSFRKQEEMTPGQYRETHRKMQN